MVTDTSVIPASNTALNSFACHPSVFDKKARLADLSPLKGMRAQCLSWDGILADISPLEGLPLTWLDLFGNAPISDLSAFKARR